MEFFMEPLRPWAPCSYTPPSGPSAPAASLRWSVLMSVLCFSKHLQNLKKIDFSMFFTGLLILLFIGFWRQGSGVLASGVAIFVITGACV